MSELGDPERLPTEHSYLSGQGKTGPRMFRDKKIIQHLVIIVQVTPFYDSLLMSRLY